MKNVLLSCIALNSISILAGELNCGEYTQTIEQAKKGRLDANTEIYMVRSKGAMVVGDVKDYFHNFGNVKVTTSETSHMNCPVHIFTNFNNSTGAVYDLQRIFTSVSGVKSCLYKGRDSFAVCILD